MRVLALRVLSISRSTRRAAAGCSRSSSCAWRRARALGHAGDGDAGPDCAGELRRDHGVRRRDASRPGRGASLARRRGRVPLRDAIDREVPLLGVCLGAQLIARAAGAGARPGAARTRSGGTCVEPNAAGREDTVLGVMPARFEAFQWHYYNFELPAGAELLAENDAARQAYRLGERTWGVQFHPEVTRHMLDHWFVEGEAELPDPAVVRRDTAFSARGTSAAGGSAPPSSIAPPASTEPERLSIGPFGRQRLVGSPLVPGADVVPRVVARRPEELDGHRRPRAGMAVGDHLGALRRTDEGPQPVRVERQQHLQVGVPRTRNVPLPRVAGIASRRSCWRSTRTGCETKAQGTEVIAYCHSGARSAMAVPAPPGGGLRGAELRRLLARMGCRRDVAGRRARIDSRSGSVEAGGAIEEGGAEPPSVLVPRAEKAVRLGPHFGCRLGGQLPCPLHEPSPRACGASPRHETGSPRFAHRAGSPGVPLSSRPGASPPAAARTCSGATGRHPPDPEARR